GTGAPTEGPAPGLVDHHGPQEDRDPLPGQLLLVLRRGRDLRAPHADRAGPARAAAHRRARVQRALHDPRYADDLPGHLPYPGRPGELLRAAADRGARHGVPPDQRAVLLAPPGRRPDDLVRLRAKGRGPRLRLDLLRA